jgi:putative ABC transport system substrate-binding protein
MAFAVRSWQRLTLASDAIPIALNHVVRGVLIGGADAGVPDTWHLGLRRSALNAERTVPRIVGVKPRRRRSALCIRRLTANVLHLARAGGPLLTSKEVNVRRREFISLIGSAAVASSLEARAQAAKLPLVVFLGNSTHALEANLVGPFLDGLRELGYREGRTIQIDYRWAEGDYSRLPELVEEIIALEPRVIVTAGTPAPTAVARATKTIPCVMIAVGAPDRTGLVASLAHPGGNLTGLTSIAPELEGKRLSLLREVAPTLSRLAVFWNPDNPFHVISQEQVQQAADVLGLKVYFVAVRTSNDVDAALTSVAAEQAEGLVVLPDRVFLHERAQLMDYAARHKLPGVYAYRELVEAGGLMSYGPSYADLHRRAAQFVDKILKGANPGDLPVEQPIAFEFVVNLASAAALGLTIPATVLARADEVIE